MASFVSSLPAFDASSAYDRQSPSVPTQAAKLTAAQQMRQMVQQGQSANLIAETLGLPLSQVQSDLGQTTTAAATSPIPLSIKA